ncbi:hypothetical protein [Sedimentitalea sp.]
MTKPERPETLGRFRHVTQPEAPEFDPAPEPDLPATAPDTPEPDLVEG